MEQEFKVHTGNLTEEILKNPGIETLRIPLILLRGLLVRVGQRASELNDPKMNALMVRLTIYSIADPQTPDYDPALCERILQLAEQNK